MKKFLSIIAATVLFITIFSACSVEHPKLDDAYQGYKLNESGDFWYSAAKPDIIDVHSNVGSDWRKDENLLNAIRTAWISSGAYGRIDSKTRDKAIFRIIPEKNDIFYLEYDPIDCVLSRDAEKRNIFLDIPEGETPVGVIFSTITENESGEYLGGTVVLDGETVTLWKNNRCVTWKCHIEDIGGVKVLDYDDDPGLYLYDAGCGIIYKFEVSSTGNLHQEIVTENVLATDSVSFLGEKKNIIIYTTKDGRIIAKSDDGGENLVATTYSDIKWPFILKDGSWNLVYPDLRLNIHGEKGTPYVSEQIGSGDYAQRIMVGWFSGTISYSDFRGY